MAVFCNQATIRYGGVVRQSNITCGEIVETVRTTIANNELGWKAQLSIDDMTLSAWKWEQNYRKG